MLEPLAIMFGAIFVHNIALVYILGMCPFISLSRDLRTASGMGVAVIAVMTLTAAVNWPVYHLILVPTGTEFLHYITFIIVIAATVQLTEMIVESYFPTLQALFGIFLPLITVNCSVLAVSLFMVLREYSFANTLGFAVGSGGGWALAIVIVAAIKERVKLRGDVPRGLKGPALTFITVGIIALAFMGFVGMVGIQ